MSRGKNETRKRVLYAHGVVFFKGALGLLLLLLFCCEKRDFLFVTYNREKKNALVGFCVCVSTYS